MKRVALFFMYDKYGVVDNYIVYLLQDIKNNVDELVTIVNGSLNEQGIETLGKLSDKVIYRSNTGFDVFAYKCGLDYLRENDIGKWDEIVMFNFTNFGPVYPFAEVFDKMDEEKVDFWGLTLHYGMKTDPYHRCKYGYIPEHIQSSFIAVRKNLFMNEVFWNYWDKMPVIKDYVDAIVNHEAVFTKYFSDKGYTYKAYVYTDDLKDIHPYPLMTMPVELISNRKCPVFKRKTFFNYYDELLDVSVGNQCRELYDYLRNNNLYDTDLIWESILRTSNMYDIKERMQLNYIVREECNTEKKLNSKVALMLHIYFEDKIDYCISYAESMPNNTDIYISTNSEEKKRRIEEKFNKLTNYNTTVLLAENRGRDVSALLVCFAPYIDMYDIICFAHDKKAYQSYPYMIGESFGYHCFENILATKEYVNGIIRLFEEESKLGLLTPPTPYHGPYFKTIGNEWSINYDNVLEMMKKWNINVSIEKDKPPIAPFGTCFWFRVDALKDAYSIGLSYDDFSEEPIGANDGNLMHVIERMYPLFAQNRGYYSAWVMTEKYASSEITNLYHYLRDYNTDLFKRYGVVERKVLRQSISRHGVSFKNKMHALLGEEIYSYIWTQKEKIVKIFSVKKK